MAPIHGKYSGLGKFGLKNEQRKLYIDDIPEIMMDEQFEQHFKPFGELEGVRVVHKVRKNGTKKNFCFVLFKNKEGFNAALKNGHFHEIGGYKLECRQIKLREELKDIQIENQKEKTLKEGKGLEGKKKKKRRRRKKKKKEEKPSV